MFLSVLLCLLPPFASAVPITFSTRAVTVNTTVDGNPLACTTGDIGIDPSIPQSYVDQFCSQVNASNPDWLVEVTGLSQGDVNLLYAWEAAGDDYSQTCSTKCVQAFTDIILTCEYDSHDMDGEGTYSEACGEFVLEITPQS